MEQQPVNQIIDLLHQQASALRKMADELDEKARNLSLGGKSVVGRRPDRAHAMVHMQRFKEMGLPGRAASMLAWNGVTVANQITEELLRTFNGMGPYWMSVIMKWKESQQ
jgi:hypothetical protein